MKVAFRGRAAVRWEVPGAASAARSRTPASKARIVVTPHEAAADPRPAPDPGHTAAATAASNEPPPAAGAPEGGSGDAELRHRVTVAHGLTKLARQRHEEERGVWLREKADLERRVADAEARAQGTVAELAVLRAQHEALTARLATIERTAEQTVQNLLDKLERATAALAAATENLEAERAAVSDELVAERQRRADDAQRHAAEVDQLVGRTADLTAERDRHAAEAARIEAAAGPRREAPASPGPGGLEALPPCEAPELLEQGHPPSVGTEAAEFGRLDVPGAALFHIAWTIAAMTLTVARRGSVRPNAAHSPVARRPNGNGPRVSVPAARLPWIGAAAVTSELGAQGPRGPPAGRG